MFAGWEPVEEETGSAQEFFINDVLFRAYKFVVDLRELMNGYRQLKVREEKEEQLVQAQKFIQQ